MNAGVAAGLLLMVGGGMYGWYGLQHASAIVVLIALVFFGGGAIMAGKWWGR